LPNVGPYIYTTLAFLALLGAPYIYDISSLRVKEIDGTVPWLRRLIDGFRLRCPGFDHRVFHEWHRDGFSYAVNILPVLMLMFINH